MKYQETLAYILGQPRTGQKKGLERMRRMMSLLGNPQDTLSYVHIAGTNGKGSTTAMTANILKEAGYRTGMFISPFILDFRERIQVDGQMIAEEELVELVEQVRPVIDRMTAEGDPPVQFEVVNALGFLYFAQKKCDIVCLEVGIGGEKDCTNVIQTPLVSVICSIALDHTSILGDTVEQIAWQKAGIIKKNGSAVVYPDLPPEALAVIMEKCAQENAQMYQGTLAQVPVCRQDLDGTEVLWKGQPLRIPFLGDHQIKNTLNVLETVAVLQMKGFAISDRAVRQGIQTTLFPARAEVLSRSPLVILDGAHNEEGAAALETVLLQLQDQGKTPLILLMGMLADKDYSHAVAKLAKHCSTFLAVTPPIDRALPKEELEKTAQSYCSCTEVWEDLEEAYQRGRELAGKEGAVVICGSLYLAADIRKIIQSDRKKEKNLQEL